MPFVQAKCPMCGGMLAVDDAKKAAICQFCGDAFVVEDAVNNYITYNVTNTITNHNFGEGAIVHIHEDKARDFVIEAGVLKRYTGAAVEVRGMLEYFGSTIGGNELKSSRATITNIKQISDTEYLVSGRMTMTDVYGDTWNNTFDCEVSKSGDNWSAGSFDYTSDNWRKG